MEIGRLKVVGKAGSFEVEPLRLFVSLYGLWGSTAALAGLVFGFFFSDGAGPQLPLPVILSALLGFGFWLADVNKRNRCGAGLIADTLLGVFISANIFEWNALLAMMVDGQFAQVRAVLSEWF